ncbi:hypothetical protein PMW00_09440 [Clostridium paraputrificum]|uniref:hypothetical protein n=1 Tax=Clostridium TaxID=1485 RepID=UPI0023309748|nr:MULTISPECIES: hypothetical protein [Clostridium]MDB2103241.1 hypothetical protein [Clostridium paraputrificum]MDU6521026.1 hypothetical protein [Clostridium sp.]
MIDDFSIIISSCDKFSDLWEQHLNQFKEHWKGEFPLIYLVTDKNTYFEFEGVKILVFDGDMPLRLQAACRAIDAKNVLVTLDDYFVIDDIREENIKFLVDKVKSKQIDYLRIYDRQFNKKKYYTSIDVLNEIDLKRKYAVSLYPAIWNKEFLIKCVDKDDTPWKFEPELTNKAIQFNAKCYYNNSGVFNILDVVRKGLVLHKANRYFRKYDIDIGDRPLVDRRVEIKLFIADFIWWYMPKWVYRLARKVAENLGMEFYS